MTILTMAITDTKEMLVGNIGTLHIWAEEVTILVYFLNTIWDETTSCGERIFRNNVSLNILQLKWFYISLNNVTID